MAKLKIKDLEGDPKDIDKLFQKHNCDLSSYIGAEKSVSKNIKIWLVSVCILHFILACLLWLDIFTIPIYKILFLSLIFSSIIIVICVYLQFKNVHLAGFSFLGILLITIVALNIYTPQQAIKKIEKVIFSIYNK